MLNAVRRLAGKGGWRPLATRIGHASAAGDPQRGQFEAEVRELVRWPCDAGLYVLPVKTRAKATCRQSSLLTPTPSSSFRLPSRETPIARSAAAAVVGTGMSKHQ